MSLSIILNGQTRSFTTLGDSSNIESLIRELGLKPDRVAIERNGEIVSRATWAEVEIVEGDRLELVHFVGGGSF